jgi:exodeoxyribonuclease-5
LTVVAWSQSQSEALERVRAWLADPWRPGASREPGVFRLFGYAGTGKSTLARAASEGADGSVRYATFTGKAALVLQRAGCPTATTIHRLIYVPRTRCAQRLRELQAELAVERDEDRARELRDLVREESSNLSRPSFSLNMLSSLRDAALLVVDECSMVGESIARDLLSFRVPILALGDPGQLPPVKDRGYFTDPRQEPDALLEEVHRQCSGSPVLELAGRARRGEPLEPGPYVGAGHVDSFVRGRRDRSIEDAARFDQIIVGRNETRRAINARVREHLGRSSPLPEPGDRLVCLRNDYDYGLLNGSQWKVQDCEPLDEDRMLVSIEDPTAEYPSPVAVVAHRGYVEGREVHWGEIRDAQCFDYAYAVTAHKAQGDQWPSVCVVDESYCFPGEERRWLYTAITRASDTVTIVR